MNSTIILELLAKAEAAYAGSNYKEAQRIAELVLFEYTSLQSTVDTDNANNILTYRTRALLVLTEALFQRGVANQALGHGNEAAALAEKIGNKEFHAKALNLIANSYWSLSNYPEALNFLTQSLLLNQEIGSERGMAVCLGNIGNIYQQLGDYSRALEYLQKALSINERINRTAGIAIVLGNIGIVYSFFGDTEKALEYYQRTLQLNDQNNTYTIANTYGNIAALYADGKFANVNLASEYYHKAIELFEKIENKAGVARNLGNIAVLYGSMQDYSTSLEYLYQALAINEEIGRKDGVAQNIGNIGATYAKPDFEGYDAIKAEEYLLKAIGILEDKGSKLNQYELLKVYSDLLVRSDRKAEAYDYFKKFHDLKEAVQTEEATKQAQLMEHRRKIEESERDRQVKLARFQEQEKILHNILPSQIADRMIDGEKTIADSYEHVSVFFSDIVGFTKLSQRVSAEELVGMLNGIFTQFDQLARKHGLEKIKTIGDAYMAVCGAPIQVDNHAERTALFALDVAELMNNYQTNTGDKVMIRIGLHSGGVVAGIIGENKFAYDLWGDAVNTASRMESHGEAGKIHVSEEFLKKLLMVNGEWLMEEADDFSSFTINHLPLTIIPRGEMDIKGKGMMKTYFLEKQNNYSDQ